MTMSRYLYLKQQETILGPFPASQLLRMYTSGLISSADQVSADKINWQNAVAVLSGGMVAAGIAPEPVSAPAPVSAPGPVTPAVNPTPSSSIKCTTGFTSGTKDVVMKLDSLDDTVPAQSALVRTRGISTSKFFLVAFVILLVVLLLGGSFMYFFMNSQSPEDKVKAVTGEQSLADIVQKNKSAVGVVIVVATRKDNGKKVTVPCGTAWAVAPDQFVTNAHVALAFSDLYKNFKKSGNLAEFEVYVAINQSKKRCKITHVQLHPEYNRKADWSDGDYAILHTGDTVEHYLKCASESELKALKQGDHIAFLGFPMEGLFKDNLNVESPVATMQEGVIVAISDQNMGDSGFEKNTLVRHNLPTVGGASGSPIFSTNGNVIAILNAGNMVFDKKGGRTAHAGQVNFAVRIDCLQKCFEVEKVPTADFFTR